MNLDTRQIDEFREITQHVIEWLKANAHPHAAVVIETTSAVLYEGVTAYTTDSSDAAQRMPSINENPLIR